MKIRILLVLSLGIVMLFQQACTKDFDPIPFYELSDEFKSYTLFQPTSSWEYQSSLLPTTETVSIGNLIEETRTQSDNVTFKYEAIDMLMSLNDIGITMIEITAGSTLNSTSSMNSLMRVFFISGDYRLVFAPQYPLGEEQIIGEQEGVYENVEIIPSLQLGDKTYSDVYHTRITDQFDYGMGDFDFYIAKYHGLVKMQNIVNGDTTVIQLVNSSLIQ